MFCIPDTNVSKMTALLEHDCCYNMITVQNEDEDEDDGVRQSIITQ